jgi:hypothetical protein
MADELEGFIRESLARGIPRERIHGTLRQAGWPADEIDTALAAWAEADYPIPVPRRRPYLSAREAFLYLVLFATLYTAAFNFGAVLFQLVDMWLPDAVRFDWRPAATRQVRDASAALLIAFPVFLWMSAMIEHSIAREPAKRASRVRKWLTYLTLFIAALVLIGDLIFLVQRLLQGELPLRVLLKVAIVFLIAGAVFGWYLGDLRRDDATAAAPSRGRRALAAGVIAVVLAVLAGGLVVSGSPRRERVRALDEQRVEHLQRIWSQLEVERKDGNALPASLDELAARPDRAWLVVRDPATGEPYGYRVVDSVTVELCAVFDGADSLAGPAEVRRVSPFWRHDAGRWCYTLPLRARGGP